MMFIHSIMAVHLLGAMKCYWLLSILTYIASSQAKSVCVLPEVVKTNPLSGLVRRLSIDVTSRGFLAWGEPRDKVLPPTKETSVI
jgi:hypothetical protein